MKTIWKFPLLLVDEQTVEMPVGAVPLSAAMQDDVLTLWCRVETGNQRERITAYVCGTGNPMPEGAAAAQYVGTVQDGVFVWHVFVSWSSEYIR